MGADIADLMNKDLDGRISGEFNDFMTLFHNISYK